MKLKRLAAWIIAMSMLVSTAPVFAEGTEDIIISTPEQLAEIAANVNSQTDTYEGKTIKLNNDIVLSGEWTPIGDKEAEKFFCGTFDGQGHEISGLNIAGEGAEEYLALFGATQNATVQNLTVSGEVSGENVAGIVARMNGGTVKDCVNNVNVTDIDTKGAGVVCLAGATADKSVIENCVNNGTIKIGEGVTTSAGVAGIISYISNTGFVEVKGCTNNGAISGGSYSGGIVSYAQGDSSCEISGCNNTGTVNAKAAGGIAGFIGDGTGSRVISNCTNSGNITAVDTAGGIAGVSQGGVYTGNANSGELQGTTTNAVVGSQTVLNNVIDPEAFITNDSATVYYKTLPEAINAAKANDTIDLMGNSVTLEVTETVNLSSKPGVTIQNGSIDIVDVKKDGKPGLIYLDKNTLKDLNISIGDYNAYSAFYIVGETSHVIIDNTNINVTTTSVKPEDTFAADHGTETLDIINHSTITTDGVKRVIINANTTLNNSKILVNNASIAFNSANMTATNSEISISNVSAHGYTSGVLKLDNTTMTVDNCGYYGLNLKEGSSFSNGSTVTVSNSGEFTNGIDVQLKGSLKVDKTSSLTAENIRNPENLIKPCASIGSTSYFTLQEALDAAQPNDVITVAEGEYSEGTITLPETLNNVTIRGAAEHKTILKNTRIVNATGDLNYSGVTFDGMVFDGSNVVITVWGNNVTLADWTFTNNIFKNINITKGNIAAVHFNVDTKYAVQGFTFTGNTIDGVTGAQNSGIHITADGTVTIDNNVINNVAFRPYLVFIRNDNGTDDVFNVTNNVFSGSAVGRAQAVGTDAAGTDKVTLKVNENVFKDITDAQQICYWKFNEEKTSADFTKNYYDISITENPNRIYYNKAASGAVFPCYSDEEKTQLDDGYTETSTDEDKVTAIELTKIENQAEANKAVGTVESLSTEVQKTVSAETVEKIIKAQGTETTMNDSDTAVAFSMNDTIDTTVVAVPEPVDVNTALKSGDVYTVTAEEDGAPVDTVSSPVLIKIKTDKDIVKVLHEHKGNVEEIPFDQKDGYVMFTMNEFSDISLVPAVEASEGEAILTFKEITSNQDKEDGVAKFDLVLEGDEFETVKNFVAGEFTTTLSGNGENSFEYQIEVNDETNIYYDTNANGTRTYHLNLKEFNETTSYTVNADTTYTKGVRLGTMTVTGCGQGVISVSDILMEKHDGSKENLAVKIKTKVGDNAIFDIKAATRKLTVNIDFNNIINNNAKAYQDMHVVISGGNLTDDIEYDLGTDGKGVDWNNNRYTVEEDLTKDLTYTVTVSGAGYRTARYTVLMDNPNGKTLNFWNNVKDENYMMSIEEGADDSNKVESNFLAGDVYGADNIINLYDLSAVVSYFGKANNVNNISDYAKYDLNRDGKIDSKDVAYVLVSWGK